VEPADRCANKRAEFGLLVQAAAHESLRSIRIQHSCEAELCRVVGGFYNIENDKGRRVP
jgi:hypothetical protein